MWPRDPLWDITFRCRSCRGGLAGRTVGEQRRLTVLNRIRSMWARLWRRRGRRTDEHEFYDQHEASRYRAEAEARGSWNPPGGDSM
jgi:hypothetical protein